MQCKSTLAIHVQRHDPAELQSPSEAFRARPQRGYRRELNLEGKNVRNPSLPTEMLPHIRPAENTGDQNLRGEQFLEVLCERPGNAEESARERVRSFGRPQRPKVPNTFAAPSQYASHTDYLASRGMTLNASTNNLLPMARTSLTPDQTFYRQSGLCNRPRGRIASEDRFAHYIWLDGYEYQFPLPPAEELITFETLRNYVRSGLLVNQHTLVHIHTGQRWFPVDVGYHLGSSRVELQWFPLPADALTEWTLGPGDLFTWRSTWTVAPYVEWQWSPSLANTLGWSADHPPQVEDAIAYGLVWVLLAPAARPELGPGVHLSIQTFRNGAFRTDYAVESQSQLVARNRWRVERASNNLAGLATDAGNLPYLNAAVMQRAAEMERCATGRNCMYR